QSGEPGIHKPSAGDMDSGLAARRQSGMTKRGQTMPEATEQMEHAMHAEHASHTNRKIGLVIAVLALFLSFSETLGKSAQTEAISANVETANLWSFFQAKTVRLTTVRTAAEELKLQAAAAAEPATKTAMDAQIAAWEKT